MERTPQKPTDADRTRHRVVVLGAGFAGLRVARNLRKLDVEVVVVDRQNHHLFQPLLYQVATAGLAAPDIAAPIRRILRSNKNARVVYGEVTGIDRARGIVLLGEDAVHYDTLVVATGATHSYFGNESWARHAPGLKTLQDAHNIRSRILRAFEAAERAPSPAAQRPWLRFVVVGAGPTGVELAGALAELARKILPEDFRQFDTKSAEVLLVEAGPRVLNAYTDKLSASARRQLEELGVTVRTDAMVTDIDAESVTLGDERIETRTVLWAAGVQASPLLEGLGAPIDRAGRVHVAPDLTVPDHPEIFVLGDAAHFEQDGKQIPGVAPAALQMGDYATQVIRARHTSRPAPAPFRYRDKGSMATIGRASAVAHLGKMQISGFFAWMTWLFVHILFLVGFRSRLVVLINWMWAYVAYRPAARVWPELAGGRAHGGEPGDNQLSAAPDDAHAKPQDGDSTSAGTTPGARAPDEQAPPESAADRRPATV